MLSADWHFHTSVAVDNWTEYSYQQSSADMVVVSDHANQHAQRLLNHLSPFDSLCWGSPKASFPLANEISFEGGPTHANPWQPENLDFGSADQPLFASRP